MHDYIVIMGLDGSGKSTVSKELNKLIPTSKLTKEPYKYSPNFSTPPHDKLIIYLYDRLFHMDLINTWLDQYHVISDRSFFCNMAYQAADGIQIHNVFLMQPKNLILPTHVVYLDTDIPTCLSRIKKRGEVLPPEKYLYTVKCNYEYIMKKYIMPPIKLINIDTTDKSIQDIVTEIKNNL